MFCEYCKTEFKTISALNNHKLKAKYCLIIQGKIESDPHKDIYICHICEKVLSSKKYLEIHEQKCKGRKKENIFNCEFCDKVLSSKQNLELHIKKCKIIKDKEEFNCEYCKKNLSTKQNLENHKNICSEKKDKEIQQKDKALKEQEQIIIKIKTQKEDYKEQLEKKDLQIKELQDKLERIANKAIEKPTTTNNLNTLNIASIIDFNNVDKVKDLIENKLNINHVVDGQKGLANFVKDNLLTDDAGKLLYVCTDPSRHIFKYKSS